MSKVRADNYADRLGTGAPTFINGVSVSGVVTATTFNGNVTGTAATFTGNVTIGGTLTYEDVTNIDSVGLITARSGIIAVGVVTATSFSGDGSNLTGVSAGLSSARVYTFNQLFS